MSEIKELVEILSRILKDPHMGQVLISVAVAEEIKGILEQQPPPDDDLVEKITQLFTGCVYEPESFDFNKARAEIRKLLQSRQLENNKSVEFDYDNEELAKKYTEKIMVWFFKNREMYYRDILYEDAKKIIKKILQRRQPEKVTVTREEIMKCVDIWQVDHADNVIELLKSKGLVVVEK